MAETSATARNIWQLTFAPHLTGVPWAVSVVRDNAPCPVMRGRSPAIDGTAAAAQICAGLGGEYQSNHDMETRKYTCVFFVSTSNAENNSPFACVSCCIAYCMGGVN